MATRNLFERLAPLQLATTAELSQAQKLQPAQTLLTWLQHHWKKPTISEREIRIFGPRLPRSGDRQRISRSVGQAQLAQPRLGAPSRLASMEIIRRPVLNPTVATPVATV